MSYLWIYLLTFTLSAEAVVLEKNQIPLSYLQKNDISTHSQVRNTLLSLDNWIDKKDKKGIEKSIEELKSLRLSWGTRNLPLIADSLRKRSHFLLQSEDYDGGVFLLEQAKKAFPEDYRIRFSLAKIYWSTPGIDLREGYSNLKEGLRLYLRSGLRLKVFVFSSILLFSFLFALSIYIYFVLLLGKNYKKLSYDLKKTLRLNGESFFSSFLTLHLILLPGIASGFYVFILTIPAFIWPYLRNVSRVILATLTAFLLFFPTITDYAMEEMVKYNSFSNRKLDDFSHKIWDTETLTSFKDHAHKDKRDPFFNISVGLIHKWQGDLPEYHRIFTKLNQDSPNYAPILVNMGNSWLLAGNLDEAMKLYQRVLLIDPNSIEAHYNLSLVLEQRLELVEAKKEYLKAYALDPGRVNRLQDQILAQKTPYKVQPMDKIPEIPDFQVRENFQISSTQLMQGVVNLLLIPPLGKESVVPLTASLFFLMLVILWRYRKLTETSKQCDTCGTVFDQEEICPLCIAMEPSRIWLDPERWKMASEKILRYSRYKRMVSTLTNLILPGTGLVLGEADLSGFILIFLTLSLLIFGVLLLICSFQLFSLKGIIIFLLGYYLILNFFLFFKVRV